MLVKSGSSSRGDGVNALIRMGVLDPLRAAARAPTPSFLPQGLLPRSVTSSVKNIFLDGGEGVIKRAVQDVLLNAGALSADSTQGRR